MGTSTARQLVLISFMVIGGVVVYDLLRNKGSLGKDQSFRAVWSLALLFLLLAILADAAPRLAGPLAVLVTLAVAIGRKGAIGAIVGQGATPTAAPAPSATQNRIGGTQ